MDFVIAKKAQKVDEEKLKRERLNEQFIPNDQILKKREIENCMP